MYAESNTTHGVISEKRVAEILSLWDRMACGSVWSVSFFVLFFIFGRSCSCVHVTYVASGIWEAECTIFKLLGMYCVTGVLFSAI